MGSASCSSTATCFLTRTLRLGLLPKACCSFPRIAKIRCPAGAPAEGMLSIPLNSEVQLTGICLVRSGGLWQIPQSFRMLLRQPQDVVVLKTPSWWNTRHTLWVLGITGGVLMAVLVWVVVLGRRLREQMSVIRQKRHSSAVLEERNRIARELHDTLEQELAGITMQLDLAVDCFQQA